MEIDLQELNYKDKIEVNEKLTLPKEIYSDYDIIDLKEVTVKGEITKDIEYNCIVNLTVDGVMVLNDSIDMEPVDYKYNIVIEEENLGNSIKTLDLIEFLWHYIVMEIPIRYTTKEDINIETEDYRVISEEEYNKESDNPFKDFHLE